MLSFIIEILFIIAGSYVKWSDTNYECFFNVGQIIINLSITLVIYYLNFSRIYKVERGFLGCKRLNCHKKVGVETIGIFEDFVVS